MNFMFHSGFGMDTSVECEAAMPQPRMAETTRAPCMAAVRVGGQRKECVMKSKTSLVTALIFGVVGAIYSQNYSVNWHTIDGGGGSSTGGAFSVIGTIGQPDATAAPMAGGPYSLSGGFWTPYVAQSEEAPVLSVTWADAGQATLSWTPDLPGWVLQETSSLTTTNWSDSASGPTNPVSILISGEKRLYRLRGP